MESQITVVEAGQVVEIVMERPPVNVLSLKMYGDLTETFRAVSKRDDVHAVTLRSAVPKAFCAGADLREDVSALGTEEVVLELRQRLARECYEAIHECAVPTVAVLNGHVLGAGTVIAACCDIRYAADMSIGLPGINAGRCGGGRHVSRLIPQGTTRLMYFTGEPISAQEAFRLDFVQYIGQNGDELAAARALAHKIATKSPLGLRLAKRALNESESLDLRQGYAREQEYSLLLGRSEDAKEAVKATLNKRKPVWTWPDGPDGTSHAADCHTADPAPNGEKPRSEPND